MQLIDFPGRNVIYAEHQDEYLPLPAYRVPQDEYGTAVCCWKLTWRERFRVLLRGRVWHKMLTFNQPLQPQLLSATKPEIVP